MVGRKRDNNKTTKAMKEIQQSFEQTYKYLETATAKEAALYLIGIKK